VREMVRLCFRSVFLALVVVAAGVSATESTAQAGTGCAVSVRPFDPPTRLPHYSLDVRLRPDLRAAAGRVTVAFAPDIATDRLVLSALAQRGTLRALWRAASGGAGYLRRAQAEYLVAKRHDARRPHPAFRGRRDHGVDWLASEAAPERWPAPARRFLGSARHLLPAVGLGARRRLGDRSSTAAFGRGDVDVAGSRLRRPHQEATRPERACDG
jgi:hypothetical protein